jgi:hypothetical protein
MQGDKHKNNEDETLVNPKDLHYFGTTLKPLTWLNKFGWLSRYVT